MNFSELEEEYQRLKGQFEAGTLTEEDFKAHLKELMIQDGEGRWWMIGYETGQWFVHDDENWVRSEPPHAAQSQRDESEPRHSTRGATGFRKVPTWGWVLGGLVSLFVLVGLLVGGSQPDLPPGEVIAAADGQQAAMEPARSALPTHTAVAEDQAPTTDLVAISKSDLISAINLASATEALAGWTLDETLLYEIFTGEWLRVELDYIEFLRDEGVVAESLLFDSQYHDFFVSADGMRAEVYLTETWETTYFTIDAGECTGRVPLHGVPQTIYLERGSAGWMIYDIVFDSDHESPEVEAC